MEAPPAPPGGDDGGGEPRGVAAPLQPASGGLAAQAAAVWAFRARVEVDVARRFERLARELGGVGGAAVVVEHAAAAAADEHRHHRLCVELVTALAPPGAAPAVVVPEREPTRLGPRGLDLRDAVAFEVVAVSCVMESLSVAALGRILERAADRRVREVAHAILRDEIDHARLGWAHVTHALGPGARRALGEQLPTLLAQTVGTELLGPPPPSGADDATAQPQDEPGDARRVPDPLEGWGALGRADRRALVRDTLRLVVLPGLARQGVDVSAGVAWTRGLG